MAGIKHDASLPIEQRVTILEKEVERIDSDIQSEKGTRSRANERQEKLLETVKTEIVTSLGKIDDRLRRSEILIATGIGIFILAKVLLPIFTKNL